MNNTCFFLVATLAVFLGDSRLFAAEPATRADLEQRLAALLTSFGLTPEKDTMPLDEGITSALPDQKIR